MGEDQTASPSVNFDVEAWERQHFEELYQHRASSAQCWLEAARKLKRAADLVRGADIFMDGRDILGALPFDHQRDARFARSMEMLPVYKFLVGLAIENLAKGIIMARDPKRAAGRKLREWGKGGHDLPSLVDTAGVSVSDDERRLLSQLSRYVRGAGRYPVAKDVEKEIARTKPTDLGGRLPADVQLADEIVDKLGRELTKYRDQQYADPARQALGPPA